MQHSVVTFVPLTVVVPTYNRPETLRATLESYLSGWAVPNEIVVVDQSDVPFNPAVLGDTRGCSVLTISSAPPSLTRARNVGASRASNDSLLFSDDDVLVDADTVALLANLMGDSTLALVAGVDLPENAVHTSGLRRRCFLADIPGLLLGMKKPWRCDGYIIRSSMRGRYPFPVANRVPTEWAMGYFFCVRRSLMQAYDVCFDERLSRYAYAEDLDFSMRYCVAARREGYNCILEPNLYVNHLGSKEWRTPSDESTRYFVENRRYISRKVFPKKWWYRLAMNWFDFLYALTQIGNHEYCASLMRHLFHQHRIDG